jgi:hypothetical protein
MAAAVTTQTRMHAAWLAEQASMDENLELPNRRNLVDACRSEIRPATQHAVGANHSITTVTLHNIGQQDSRRALVTLCPPGPWQSALSAELCEGSCVGPTPKHLNPDP